MLAVSCSAILLLTNFLFVYAVDFYIKTKIPKKIYAIEANRDQINREKRNSALTTPIHAALLFAFLATNTLKVKNETLPLILMSFVLTFVWTEIWHYASHRAMHHRALHKIHKEHHKSRITNVWSSVSFSFLEKLIFSLGILGPLSLASEIVSISAVGVTAYYVMYFFTNTLGHANFEFRPVGYGDTLMGKIFNSPSYHAIHHARYIKNYGLLTPFLDNIFGTRWHDSSDIQSRVAAGMPLRSLNEQF